MNRPPRLLAYSHDGYGLGHLRRNLRIVSGLRQQRPDLEALLVTGAKSAERFVAPFGLECAPLPPVVKVSNGHYIADGSDASFDEVIRRRSAILADAVEQFRPDLLLADRYPAGLGSELAAALRLHVGSGGSTVLGLRDILDSPASIKPEWRRRGYSAIIRDNYTSVLCYGDPAVYDPIAEYGLCPDVSERIRFTGYLADDLMPRDPVGVRHAHGVSQRLAVCALGGGKDAAHVAELFLAALEQLHPRGWDGLLIAGPYMAPGDFSRLSSHPAARFVSVLRMVDDLPSYLSAADAAVCMGGYNTTCELLGLAVPAVIIPRTQPRQEQLMRTQRLAARELLWWLHPDRASGGDLADRIEHVAALPRHELAARISTIAHAGIASAAQHLAAWLPGARAGDDAPNVDPSGRRSRREAGVAGR